MNAALSERQRHVIKVNCHAPMQKYFSSFVITQTGLPTLRSPTLRPLTLCPTLCAPHFALHILRPHTLHRTICAPYLAPTLCASTLCAPKFCDTNSFCNKIALKFSTDT